MAVEPEMSDEQFAEEIKDLVRRLNMAAHEAGRAGIEVEYSTLNADHIGGRFSHLDVKVRRAL